MKKIFFRADASNVIGYGHFIRSLALADMLCNDFECVIFTQEPTEYQIRELEKVCKYVVLPNDDSKFQKFIDYLSGNEIVVLDNYFYTSEYQLAIKNKGCRLVAIDDLHDKHFFSDVIINHGCDYKDLYSAEPYTKYCLGVNWALLRREFLDKNLPQNSSSDKIFVCFGGADSYNLTDKFIKNTYCQKFIKEIDVVVGNHYQKTLPDEYYTNVVFYKNVSAIQLADLLSSCRWAISSASTICIEALACGVNVAAGFYVDNQYGLYNYFVRNNYIVGLGDLLKNDFANLDFINANISLTKPNFGNIKSKYIELFKQL